MLLSASESGTAVKRPDNHPKGNNSSVEQLATENKI